MSDDFSDWGSYDDAQPATAGASNNNPFADWGDPELDAKTKADEAKGMDWTDTVKNVASGVVGDVAAAATAGQVAAERAGYPGVAKFARETSTDLHNLSQQVEESMSPAARKSRDAALLKSNDEQERLGAHPGRQLAMKGSGIVAPGAVGVAGGILGGIIGSAIGPEGTVAGAAYGTAAAGAGYGLVKGIDQAVAWTNKLSDEELEKEAPVFGQFKKMYLEKGMTPEEASYEARVGLHEGLYGIGQAAMDAGTNALAFGAGRKIVTGAFGEKKLIDYALSGGSLGAASASGDINEQNVENVKKGTNVHDLGRTAMAFINGGVEGLAFHGMSERGHALKSWLGEKLKDKPAEPARDMSPDLFNQQSAAPSTGAAPKTTRSDTQPPPNEAAQEGEIGNTVNPPTRDQGVGPKGAEIKAKKNAKEAPVTGSVEVLNENAPAADIPADQVQALKDTTAGTPDEVKLAEPQQATPEVTAPEVAVPEVAPPEMAAPIESAAPEVSVAPEGNIPEAAPTVELQVDDFLGKKRDFVRFENEDQTPDPPDGVLEYQAPDGSVWWYHNEADLPRIESAVEGGTENELLGLGPHNKEAVAQSVAQGAEPAAVVAREPETGVETAAAASTMDLAPETLKAVQEANPEANVTIEQPQGVAEGRLDGTGVPETPPVAEPVKPTGRILEVKLSPEEQARVDAAEAAENARLTAEKKKADQIARGLEEKPEVVQGERKSRDTKRNDEKAANAEKSRFIFEQDDFRPTEAESALEREGATKQEKGAAKTALLDRLRRVVEAATRAGYEIPGSIRNHLPHETFIKNAQKLLSKYGRSKAFERTADEPFIEILKSERLQRSGNPEDFKVDLADRRQKGDEKFQKKTGDFEREVADESAGPVNIEADTVRDYEAGEAREAREEETLVDEETPEAQDRPDIFKTLRKKGTAEKLVKLKERLAKVKALAERGATEGERAAAGNRLRRLQERFKEELKGSEVTVDEFITKGTDKAGTFKVETPKRRKPQSRSFGDFESVFGSFERDNRDTGERDGHVSYGYGSTVASAEIGRTASVRDVFDKETFKHSRTGGLFGGLFRHIRGKLIDVAGDVKVHFISAEEMARIHKDGAAAKGFYKEKGKGEGGYIVMVEGLSREEMAHVFTHEALHAATSDALSSSPRLTEQVKAIMGEVQKALPDKWREYGFKDEHEFIAEAFSNKRFQEYLTQVKVSPELARALGLPEMRARSVWSAMARLVQKFFKFDDGSMTALEALMRPTSEAMERFGVEGRGGEHSLTAKDVEKFGRDRLTNARSMGRKLARASASNTMLGQMSARFGTRYGKLARKAVELRERMATRTGEILERQGGGHELIKEGDALRRADPTNMAKAMDLGHEITGHNLDMSANGDNSHVFGKTPATSNIVKTTQAKEAYKDLKRRLDELKRDAPKIADWLERMAKAGREEDNNKRLAVIRNVLEYADLGEAQHPGLAQRVFENKLRPSDVPLFDSVPILQHLNELASVQRLKGWYFPYERKGDHVVTARKDFDIPTGAHVHYLKGNNEVVFTDPKGKGQLLPAKRAAQQFARDLWNKHKLYDEGIDKVFVLKSDPSKVVSAEEANAIGAPDTIKAYRVKVNNEYMSLHETPAERDTRAAELKEEGWRKISTSVKRDNPNAYWGGLVPSQMETIINSLQGRKKFQNLSAAQQAELTQSLRQATIKLLPGSRIQHHNLQRRRVAGYQQDMINSMARYFRESAAFQARTEFQPQINRTLQDLQQEIKNRPYSKLNEQMQEMKNELETRLSVGAENAPRGPVAKMLEKPLRTLNKLSMLDKLAGPSFHIINSMEVGTTAGPVIAGRHGIVNTVRTIKDAYNMIGARGALIAGLKDTGRAFTQDTGFTNFREMMEFEINRNVPDAARAKRLRDVIDNLHELNLFGHEAGMEIQRMAEPATTRPGQLLDKADLVSRQMGQAIEAINRAVTGLASYELEYKRNGGNHLGAMAYAHDTVHDTMGNYSASNAAPVFNSMLGKSALQFKKFAQKTYFLMGKLAGNAYRGDREAMKSFAGLMFTHGVMAGALGLPLEPIKVAMMASNALGLTGFSYDDFERAVRETAATLLGKTGGEIATRGLPRALGVDLSSRVGLESLLTFGKPFSEKSNDLKAYLFDTIAGAPLGMPFKLLEAAQAGGEGVSALFSGNVDKALQKGGEAFDKGVPVKMLRDFGRAGAGLMGGKVDRNGRQLMNAYSPYEAGVRAMGFTPGREAELQEERNAVREQTHDLITKRRSLMNDWINAKPESKDAAIKAIAKFNEGKPKDQQITFKQLQSGLKARQTEKRKGTYDQGMRITKQSRDFYNRAEGVYGSK